MRALVEAGAARLEHNHALWAAWSAHLGSAGGRAFSGGWWALAAPTTLATCAVWWRAGTEVALARLLGLAVLLAFVVTPTS